MNGIDLLVSRKNVFAEKIEGDTWECLGHYSHGIPKTPGEEIALRRQLIDFVGISLVQTKRLLQHGKQARGENLIRLRFYLYYLGYSVEELNSLGDETFELANLFALGFASLTAISDSLGVGRDSAIRRMRKVQKLSASDVEKTREIVSHIKARVKDDLPKIIPSFSVRKMRVEPKRLEKVKTRLLPRHEFGKGRESVQQLKECQASDETKKAIDATAALIESLLPLSELLLSDEFSAQERAELRRKVNGHGLFNLANNMNALCSETARNSR